MVLRTWSLLKEQISLTCHFSETQCVRKKYTVPYATAIHLKDASEEKKNYRRLACKRNFCYGCIFHTEKLLLQTSLSNMCFLSMAIR
jgi:hypothetical protein